MKYKVYNGAGIFTQTLPFNEVIDLLDYVPNPYSYSFESNGISFKPKFVDNQWQLKQQAPEGAAPANEFDGGAYPDYTTLRDNYAKIKVALMAVDEMVQKGQYFKVHSFIQRTIEESVKFPIVIHKS